jgi:zeta-carotene desaturase
MKRVGALQNLRLKEHTHTFVNTGGNIGELDFRLGGIGAPINGLAAFARSTQLEVSPFCAQMPFSRKIISLFVS